MKAMILARVSTEEQKDANNSLPAQLTRLRKYLDGKQITVQQEFVFDESAYATKREEFDKVIDILKNSKEPVALCCDKIDRLIRNFSKELVILEELRRDGKIEMHFPSDNIILHKDSPAADLFRLGIGVSLAKYYSDAISDGVKRGIEGKLSKGEFISKAPVGYRNVAVDGKKSIIPDPTMAPLITKIFELYAEKTHSMKTLSEEMKRHGLLNSKGEALGINQIERILTNPFYHGVMEIKGKEYPHCYKPIITRQLFERCEEVRKGRFKSPTKYGSKPFVLRGLITCSICGCMITAEAQGKYIYYRCTNYRGMHKPIYIREEKLLEPILAKLKSLELSEEKAKTIIEEVKRTNENQTLYHKNVLTRLQQELAQNSQRKENLFNLLLDGRITQQKHDFKLEELNKKEAELNRDIQKHSEADADFHINVAKVVSVVRNAYQLFQSSEVDQKRQILQTVLQNCTLDGKKLNVEFKELFNLLAAFNVSPNKKDATIFSDVLLWGA